MAHTPSEIQFKVKTLNDLQGKMRRVSKEIVLGVELGGMMQDQWGNTRVGFTITDKLNRKDYGVSFSMVHGRSFLAPSYGRNVK